MLKACKELNQEKIVVAGGVGANSRLREKLEKYCKDNQIQAFYPDLKYCTDNAAMIGSIAYYYILNGIGLADLTLTAKPVVGI